jgi:multiple sugar transport system substrate-binding protein
MFDAFTAANPNIKVTLDEVDYNALHDKIVTDALGGHGVYDVVMMDGVWAGEFAQANIVRDLTDQIPASYKSGIIPAVWGLSTYNGKTYGVPYGGVAVKYLLYNKKIFAAAGISAPPKTLDELVTDAQAIKAKGIVQYPLVGSWAQREAVICDWTQLAAVFGNANFMFDAQGNPTFNSGGGLAALKFMKQTLDQGIANPASLGYVEDNVQSALSSGQAAMALQWAYGFPAANDPSQSKVAGQIAIAPEPGEGSQVSSGINGGDSLGVTTYSKNPDDALKLILYMTSQAVQDKNLQNMPEWASSYDNPDLTKTQPDMFAATKIAVQNIVSRPVIPYYTKLSNALQVAIQQALLGQKSPEQALNDVAAQVPAMEK